MFGSGSMPLRGVRVLDATDWVSGPVATMAMADLGAEVVKVERPGKGDPFRNFGLKHAGVSAFWTNINHGKRSVSLDLRSAEGQETMRGLAAAADIFIQNWRPGKAEDMQLGDATLAALNPRLIRVSISGFGASGPRASEPAFDGVLQALSGVVAAQGRKARPDSVAMYLMDKLCGLYACQAVLAALLGRADRGLGCRIDVAMLDVAAYFNFPDIFQDQTFLDSDARLAPSPSPVIATRDGHVIIVPVSGKQIGATCHALGHPEWTTDLKTIRDPNLLIGTLYKRVEEIACDMPTADLLVRLQTADVAVAEVLDPEAHLADPQVVHNQIYEVERQDSLGQVRRVRYPARFDGERLPMSPPAPTVGHDTAAVLSEWIGDAP